MSVKITETILRDAHQSLLATRMRTRDMLEVVEQLDQIGYFSLEMWGGATFDSCIRYLNEDPWQRLRDIKKEMKDTYAQMLLRGQNLVGYRHYSDDVVEKFVTKSYQNGIDIFRIFDAVNDIRNMESSIKVAKGLGAHVQGTVCYTISPVHTVEKYVELAKQLEELECDSICIKDMAGLLSPNDATRIISSMKKEISIPISLHCHCTSGMAPMSYMAACEAGVDILDTALSPLAWGTSQPPTETVVAALKGTPYDTGLDLNDFEEVVKYFKILKEKYRGILDPISEQIDTNVLIYQIPGGMLSNLVSQLKEQNALDKYDAVLDEMPRVRKELGYPPLVTPTSQIVGTQSVLNVLMGERYKVIPKEVKDYVRGLYGRPPAPISPEIIGKVIGDEEPIHCRPADLLKPEYEKRKKEAEEMGIAKSEEDILTYILYPAIAPKFLKGEMEEEALAVVTPAPEVQQEHKVPTHFKVEVDEDIYDVRVEPVGGEVSISEASPKKSSAKSVKGAVSVSMQGMVLSLKVKVEDTVAEGDTIAVIEAMKMENAVHASHSGVVREIFVSEGDTVSPGDIIMSIE
ncbi:MULTISPECIES: sodium-extruding oxaloacetate decarboxylase subunit alpha [Methanosarcina]|uniref:Pyruvate carboxyl transferase subunit B n=3 Tax=Methanosarcina barkeri TaxID=2208 RepID=A0A0E3QWJ0_METBA|nr:MULTISPECIES: sodium-extruding oxaloacetate decarboxylase subunit alpha [Methanosarcina]AKB55870.1 Pyruvate carboxyl transferase subunit B [Methanosarcina barkeri MS]AKB59346.1 Pyruvate carboxyl transferase subunit B [Methanosarcina barkeri 227]AKJ40017.1 pyruvate carboxylase subunit B PycB [Methanosarcina barkeri CM1]OED07689.1 oxaloacetate decarboxylase subunit alpha [Methanosarcina sp. A14]